MRGCGTLGASVGGPEENCRALATTALPKVRTYTHTLDLDHVYLVRVIRCSVLLASAHSIDTQASFH